MSTEHASEVGVERRVPLGIAVLCGLNSLGAVGVSVFALRVLANGHLVVGLLAGGLVPVTVLLVVGLWNRYTWGWELGIAYYALALAANLAFLAVVAGQIGEVHRWTLPGPVLSFGSLAYLVAARHAFG